MYILLELVSLLKKLGAPKISDWIGQLDADLFQRTDFPAFCYSLRILAGEREAHTQLSHGRQEAFRQKFEQFDIDQNESISTRFV